MRGNSLANIYRDHIPALRAHLRQCMYHAFQSLSTLADKTYSRSCAPKEPITEEHAFMNRSGQADAGVCFCPLSDT
eukprot:3901144-Pleurochrysis_carterae.AAC.3